ncbi:MAG: hypothetical protein RLZ75_814 [Pseudomonadota bacterium]|jgi:hypothetical protein
MTTDLRKLNNYWLVREGGQLIWTDWVVVRNFEKEVYWQLYDFIL